MIRSGTRFLHFHLRIVGVCIVFGLVANRLLQGQISIEVVVPPSPMIARGHLEGGINGEGNLRPDGKTPLMLAVEAGDLPVVEYLLQHGADPDLRDFSGKTALDLAQRRTSAEVTAALTAHAAAHPAFASYYADKRPVLAAHGARSQSGSPGCGAAHSLVVRVTSPQGEGLPNAPVRFAVKEGGGYLLTQPSSPGSASLLLYSDESGLCRANVKLPREANKRVQIVASVGAGKWISETTFTVLTNDGSGGDSASWYDPTDLQAEALPGADLNLSWTNHTEEAAAVKISEKTPTGWKVFKTVPANPSHVYIPAKVDRTEPEPSPK